MNFEAFPGVSAGKITNTISVAVIFSDLIP